MYPELRCLEDQLLRLETALKVRQNQLVLMYSNSGNFRVKKFSPIKFSYQKIFVPATPYRSNMHTLYTAMKNFVHKRAYENILMTKISRTTVYVGYVL